MVGMLNAIQENIRLLRADVEDLQRLAHMQNTQIENLESRLNNFHKETKAPENNRIRINASIDQKELCSALAELNRATRAVTGKNPFHV